jgi:hypothetical protein
MSHYESRHVLVFVPALMVLVVLVLLLTMSTAHFEPNGRG